MSVVLDRAQLEDVTLGDSQLMREIVSELVTDTAAQLEVLRQALSSGDRQICRRVAHSAKGACANVGARAMAELLLVVERRAAAGDLEACGESLPQLSRELDRLRERVESL
jgi:HPt (histidine-containing phosphotransfer) domain-containing protein